MSSPDPAAVRATFTSVAQRYDLANHLLSGGIDFHWRKKLVAEARKGSCMDVLDLATGSGDVALALRKKLPSDSRITGLDFCEPMLEKARQKRESLKLPENQNPFVEGDCLALPFPKNSYDLVTISFGLRNLADRELGLSEMFRVLKPGGRLIVLEFTQPYLWFSPFYYLYLKGFLPWMARLVTGDKDAYLYLGSSISSFPDRPTLSKELEQAGFSRVRATPLTFSIVALHCGEKPKLP